MRASPVLQLVPAALCAIAAGMIYRQTLVSAAGSGWRRHAAASIPAVYTLFLLLVWVLPIQIFLSTTLEAEAWLPVLGLSLLGVVLAARLPPGYFQLRRAETDGSPYVAVGVRRFRSLVTYGDPMVRLMRRIEPASRARLKRSMLDEREKSTRRSEKIHWALLLGSVPSAVWAVLVRESWFAVYLLVANIPMNVFPILLQRYTRARLARIREHSRCRANGDAAELSPAIDSAAVAGTNKAKPQDLNREAVA